MLEKIHYKDSLPINVQVLKIEEYPWHMHDDIQIIYIMEGEIELKMIYTRYYLKKNHIHIIHSDDVHGMKGLTENNLVVLLSFDMEYFSKFHADLDTQIFTTKSSGDIATYKRQLRMKSHIFSIISELYDKGKGYQDRIRDLSLEVIDTLYKDFRGFTVDRETRNFEHKVSHDLIQIDRISRVISLVYQNYPYKLSLSAIADKENINPYYLSHLFQKLVGDSFRNFVSMVRVEMSEAELLTTETSISQISQNVGFSNAKYYVENFKEWFGCHPREYRQLYRGQILGQAPIKAEELPLESINKTIDSYLEFPVFVGASAEITSANIDLTKAPVAFLETGCPNALSRSLYEHYDPHIQCASIAGSLLTPPHRLPTLFPMDSPGNTDGLLTINGMKKPQYYLFQLLRAMHAEIICAADSYLLAKEKEDFQLLLFNSSHEAAENYEFNFFKITGPYQITEKRFQQGRSCITGWGELGFKETLSKSEWEAIAAMSMPDTSFHILTAQGSYTYSSTLLPREIVFLDIKKCE